MNRGPGALIPYDAIETPTAFALILASEHGLSPLVRMELTARGVEARFADGRAVRFGNIHPGLARVVPGKTPHLVTIRDGDAVVQRIGGVEDFRLSEIVGPRFYWYVGPESDDAESVAARPFSVLMRALPPTSVAVSPGRLGMGPPIGLCLSEGVMTPLARGRRWITVSPGLVAEEAFVTGTSSGHPADKDIEASVVRAHSSSTLPAPPAERMAWRGSYACIVDAD